MQPFALRKIELYSIFYGLLIEIYYTGYDVPRVDFTIPSLVPRPGGMAALGQLTDVIPN